MDNFAERLKELRIEKGMSQRVLAKETGYSQAAIARWESGIQTPNIDVAIKFSRYFNVSADYLLGLTDY